MGLEEDGFAGGLRKSGFIDLKEVHRQQQFHKLDADQIVRAIAPT